MLDHPAAFAISFNDSLLHLDTFDDDADLVECALKVVILIPDFSNTSVTHRAIVVDVTGLYGCT